MSNEKEAPNRIFVRPFDPDRPLTGLYKTHDIAAQRVNEDSIEYLNADYCRTKTRRAAFREAQQIIKSALIGNRAMAVVRERLLKALEAAAALEAGRQSTKGESSCKLNKPPSLRSSVP